MTARGPNGEGAVQVWLSSTVAAWPCRWWGLTSLLNFNLFRPNQSHFVYIFIWEFQTVHIAIPYAFTDQITARRLRKVTLLFDPF